VSATGARASGLTAIRRRASMEPMGRMLRTLAALAAGLAVVVALPAPCSCSPGAEPEHAQHSCCAPPTGVRASDHACCGAQSAVVDRASAPPAPDSPPLAVAAPTPGSRSLGARRPTPPISVLAPSPPLTSLRI
jgi:hypothetical protein